MPKRNRLLLTSFSRLVTRLVFLVGRIESRQRCALLDLLHDPRFEPFLFGRSGDDLVDERCRNHHRPVRIDDDQVIGEDRYAAAANGLLPVGESQTRD